LDWMILEVFSNLNDSVILWQSTKGFGRHVLQTLSPKFLSFVSFRH